jgi:hypothetical protein
MPEGLVNRAQQVAPDPAMASPAENPMAMSPQPVMDEMEGAEPEVNTTPEEDQAHESAMQMVAELLYANDKSNAALMDTLNPDAPAQSAADASVFLLSKVEETFQGNYPEALILPTADEISDMVLEVANESGKFEVTEDIAVQAKSLMVQQLIKDYGVDEAAFKDATQDVTEEDLNQYQQMFGGANA